jgi:ubiquitin-protein ligase
MSSDWHPRWKTEYELAAKRNSTTRTIVPAKKHDLSTWKGYLKTRDGQLHSMEVRLEYRAHAEHRGREGRMLYYPLFPPDVEWQTPIRHPNIQPPRPKGEGIICLAPFQKPDSWNPKTHVIEILDFIEVLLHNPNPADPINHPTCLEAAIAIIRDKLAKISSPPIAKRIPHMLTEAEGVIRKYSDRWTRVTETERPDRDRAWYLIVEAGKTVTAAR